MASAVAAAVGTAARRAASIAIALSVGAAANAADHAHAPLTADAARRVALGEAALARGAADEALAAFESAAATQHAAAIEMGIVRAQMQAGQYRRALAFAAHVAGAHADEPAGAAMYAWLLRAGGQRAYARRVLDEASARSAGDDVLREARAAFDAALPVARGALLEAPHRLAPEALTAQARAPEATAPDASGPEPVARAGASAPGATARIVATAMLVDEGRAALVPADAVEGVARLRVRDGLGRTRTATLAQRDTTLGIAVLRLAEPLPGGARIESPPAAPWAGSPGFVVEHAPTGDATPQWPWLSPGFFGDRGIAASGASGGVVFDAAGRWAGIVLPGDNAASAGRWVPASALRRAWPAWWPASADGAPPPRIGADEAYERALPLVLQVIGER